MNPRMNKGWAYKNTRKRNSIYDDFGVYLVFFMKFFLTLFLLNFHVRAQAFRLFSLAVDKKIVSPLWKNSIVPRSFYIFKLRCFYTINFYSK